MVQYSIIIPGHNEADNIEALVSAVNKTLSGKDFEIVFVNDNSSDNSEEILGKLKASVPQLRPINRRSNRGVGNALREGYKAARGKYIIQLDGDLSHDPAEIPKFIEKLKEYDVVCGARFIEEGVADMNFSRIVISKTFNFFLELFLGLSVHDLTSGYRMYRREVFEKIELNSSEFGIYPEVALKAHRAGFRIGEVPIHYHPRVTGTSKLSYLKQGPEYIKVLLAEFLRR